MPFIFSLRGAMSHKRASSNVPWYDTTTCYVLVALLLLAGMLRLAMLEWSDWYPLLFWELILNQGADIGRFACIAVVAYAAVAAALRRLCYKDVRVRGRVTAVVSVLAACLLIFNQIEQQFGIGGFWPDAVQPSQLPTPLELGGVAALLVFTPALWRRFFPRALYAVFGR
jgi:branched-subunit amino acid ABC-type transport system permease component